LEKAEEFSSRYRRYDTYYYQEDPSTKVFLEHDGPRELRERHPGLTDPESNGVRLVLESVNDLIFINYCNKEHNPINITFGSVLDKLELALSLAREAPLGPPATGPPRPGAADPDGPPGPGEVWVTTRRALEIAKRLGARLSRTSLSRHYPCFRTRKGQDRTGKSGRPALEIEVGSYVRWLEARARPTTDHRPSD
jgi:hypothetical protein